MVSEGDIERVKETVSMKQLAEYYGFKINRSGYMCCPFHNEKTPSMRVYEGERGYCCFGCGAGGDVIKFVRDYEDLSFEESVRRIADMFSIPVSEEGEKPPPEESSRYRTRRLIAETEKKLQETNRSGMIELSEKIRVYEWIFRNTRPYGGLFCYLANKLPAMRQEWEYRYGLLCEKK